MGLRVTGGQVIEREDIPIAIVVGVVGIAEFGSVGFRSAIL